MQIINWLAIPELELLQIKFADLQSHEWQFANTNSSKNIYSIDGSFYRPMPSS